MASRESGVATLISKEMALAPKWSCYMANCLEAVGDPGPIVAERWVGGARLRGSSGLGTRRRL